jgi:4-amino-4-deoxy-L-arabinose transferase-like glycosyltransferase
MTAGAAAGGRRLVLWLVVAAGIAVRLLGVDRPLDHRLLSAWREADYTQIARNFYREDGRLLYPRVDWRRDTPGLVEMELPVIPWAAAALYRQLGYRESYLRLLSAGAAVAGLLVFTWLAGRLLAPPGRWVAVACFAANPLLIHLASAMQPESAVLLLSMAAFALIVRWSERPSAGVLFAAALALAAAALVKAPAAHVGLVIVYFAVKRAGWRRALADPRLLAAALVALLPPIAWYAWAHRFYTLYGNSLGISNESHFIGLDVLWPPRFLAGNLEWETLAVFTPPGVLLALAGLRTRRARLEPALVWYGAAWVFYLVAARTTGDSWARYYHAASIPAGCLLMGAGAAALAAGEGIPHRLGRWARHAATAGRVLTALTVLALAAAAVLLVHRRDHNPDLAAMRRAALAFAPHVPPAAAIVASGGPMFDAEGHPVAHNESMVFAWMDRRGFNYGHEELSLALLDDIAAHGGRFWVVQARELERRGLGAAVTARYRLVATTGEGYALYDLASPPTFHPGPGAVRPAGGREVQ